MCSYLVYQTLNILFSVVIHSLRVSQVEHGGNPEDVLLFELDPTCKGTCSED